MLDRARFGGPFCFMLANMVPQERLLHRFHKNNEMLKGAPVRRSASSRRTDRRGVGVVHAIVTNPIDDAPLCCLQVGSRGVRLALRRR